MSAVKVIHLFKEVHMGYSHAGLTEIFAEKTKRDALEKGEVALYVNKSWSAVKLLTANGTLLYHRAPSGMVTPEMIRAVPTHFGGPRLSFAGNLEATLLKVFEEATGKRLKRLRAAKSA